MFKSITSSVFLALILMTAVRTVQAGVSVITLGTALAKGGLTEAMNDNSALGKRICEASGRPSFECPSSGTLGQGLCLSGGRPSYDCSTYTNMGQGICLSHGRPSYDCSTYTRIGQGICLAGGRPSYDCSTYTEIGAGICLSTGRPSYECSTYTNPAQGLCLAKGQPAYRCSSVTLQEAVSLEIIDLDWAWDKFNDEKRSEMWRCRGRSTGQFADDSKCEGKPKNDDEWPGLDSPV